MKVPLAKPFIPNTVLKEMKSLIKKGFLTEGHYTKEFEKYVKEFINVNIVLPCLCDHRLEEQFEH